MVRAMPTLYDSIGRGYAGLRRPDPRLAFAIEQGLGAARTVLNVGSGTGSYEPGGRSVFALDPSAEMIAQRGPGAAPACRGIAEALPFRDDAVDAAMAVLTVHHWSDWRAGLAEMRRVARDRVVILSFDASGPYFWLKDYVPQIVDMDQPIMPALDAFEDHMGPVRIETVPVPHDCTDGFLGAYWRRPHAYLDPKIRAAMSTFAKLPLMDDQLARLDADLASGAWARAYGDLLDLEHLDIGYRLVVAERR